MCEDNLYQGYDTKTGNKTVVYEYSEGSRTFYVEEVLSGGNMSSKQMIIVGADSKPSFLKKYKKIVIGIANDTDVAEQNRSTGQQTSPATTSMTQRHSTDYNNSIAQTAADSQAFPNFSDRSPDEPISEAEFRAAYAARVAREAAVIRSEEAAEKTEVSFDLEQAAFEKQLNDRKDGFGKKNGSYNGTYFNLGITPSVPVKHGAKQVPLRLKTEIWWTRAKKAPMWFTSRGLQLPKLVQTIIDANTTVSQNNSVVNSKYTQSSKNDADVDGFSVGGVNAKTADGGYKKRTMP